jgi:ATP-dependent RNA circularization protein (DNA/RNA ligase family)
MKQIIALGGGGFLMEPENPLLDTYILAPAGKARPKICFVPTASGDSEKMVAAFYDFFKANPSLRLYGEWLIPHTLKTYRGDAWRKFWVFDVFNDATDSYLTYDTYQPLLDSYLVDYIPPLAKVKNGNLEHFIHVLERNNFFIQDGKGIGEGIVLKNYQYYNKYQRKGQNFQ